ncbi:MAG: hypothetical protein KAR01_11335 [Desulfocapsa sp.]|nr:hypothetical protein [Desulfocapsa sp.]
MYLANVFLVLSVGVTLISLYSWWAANYTKELGPLVAGFYIGLMLYASYGLILLAIIGVVVGFFKKYPIKRFILTICISALPIAFLVVADYF